ncbi:hypothetical protein [Neorhizobium sp. NCHU2750]|uniref:hypothetical protein n=1 Tax=Neorhizobium sp. NCHU2750 TaxID=1825976 RepID=UPI000E7518E6|nr:hypothetical protein NCHU2750_06500 [Neorhizobium sp. NCHU2750]
MSVGIRFSEVRKQEYRAILARRRRLKSAGLETSGKDGRPEDLLGIALSGGGNRSAVFCLGALQALDAFGLIRRADYLSTVSGGGYIGAGMVAAMTRGDVKSHGFPYAAGNGPKTGSGEGSDHGNDMSDSEAVSHIRDHSRYLIPHGLSDVLVSAAILLRGIAVNLFLILFLIVPLATVNVLNNPTVDHLGRSAFYDVAAYYLSNIVPLPQFSGLKTEPLLATKALGLALLAYLIGWGLWKSLPERQGMRPENRGRGELSSTGMTVARFMIVLFLGVAMLELQGPILTWLATTYEKTEGGQTSYRAFYVLLAGIVAATASQQKRLAGWIEKGFDSPQFKMKLRAVLSHVLLFIAALIVPLLIYGAYLQISLWGIQWATFCLHARIAIEACLPPDSPAFVSSAWAAYVLLAAILVMLVWEVVVFGFTVRGRDTLRLLGKRLREPDNCTPRILCACLALIIFLLLSTVATRGFGPGGDAHVRAVAYQVAINYVLASVLVVLLTMNFANNANSLHRLYRDRLNVAFRLGGKGKGQPLLLHELNDAAPYLLINGTLNARLSQDTLDEVKRSAGQAGLSTRTADPAMRGRNAEFFLFSRFFVGSDTTGYTDAKLMWERDKELNLASAVAISGAAVSSAMGRIKLGLLSPTLALLNLRLGYWLGNPRYAETPTAELPPNLPWHDFFNAYLIAESFGLLRSDSSKVYVTDGGHIDNIGLYQLLKRKCEHIIIIDAEADPAMNFGALVDVQRFARIDLGYRIVLDWQHLRDAAAARQSAKGQRVPASQTALHDCHFATGYIDYGDGKRGTLLYIKAIVTGDESDYVLDYERRFPAFPHEATSDQFFSEEQMEAYRALGFHAVRRALSVPSDEPPLPETSDSENTRWSGVARMRQALHVTVGNLE